MCEIHRLTTNTCLTQVLIFKYHKVMNKIPLSGFCLLLKSRHKHLFRIMRITYMLLFAAIFCLHAENAISQKMKVCRNTRCAFFFSLTIKIGSFF